LTLATTAKGDLLAGTGSNTAQALTVGANDTVLTADSTTATGLKWAAAAAGGMTLLSTTAITAVSSISITGIDQTYNELVIVIENMATANTAIIVSGQFNSNTTTGQYAFGTYVDSATGFGNVNASTFRVTPPISATANMAAVSSTIRIARYTNTTRKAISIFTAALYNNQTTMLSVASFLGSAAITSFQIFPETGNFTAQGNIYIYGVK